VKRVVLTGSESSGKSSLGLTLAERYGAALVPEFVRTFAGQKGAPIEFSDHGPIARGQIALEDDAIAAAPRLIVQDTDLLSTVVYCRHYFGRCPRWIEDAVAARKPDLYLLCDIDVPWIADGVRDRGHARAEMHALFAAAVAESGVPFIGLRGALEERLEVAARAIDRLLAKR
jgi:NadR type nicotinamide-nucleotide adenylyltransferase